MIYARKSKPLLLTVVFTTLLGGALPLSADTLTVSVSGLFGAGVTADQLAAPGGLWALSFEVDSDPAAANTDMFGFDAPFSDFSYLLDGSPVAVTPESIRFFTSDDGGLFTVYFGPETGFYDGMPIPEFIFSGDPAFSGTTDSPTILPGSYPVGDVTYSDALNYDDEGASGTVTIGGPQSSAPEPSTFWLCLTVTALAMSLRFRLGRKAAAVVKLTIAGRFGEAERLVAHSRRNGSSAGPTRNLRWLAYALMPAVLPGIARAQFFKAIDVVPGVQTYAVATWYVFNCSTSGGVGTYTVNVQPMHGSLSFGQLSAPAPGCPQGSPSLPAVVAYYTWTDTTPGVATDFFELYYILDGEVAEVQDIDVYNTQAQLGKLLGRSPCDCAGAASAGGTSDAQSQGPAGASGDSGGSGQQGAYGNASPLMSLPNGNNAVRTSTSTDVSSGNMFYAITDYVTAGQNKLDFTRYYNSRGSMAAIPLTGFATVVPLASGLNANWRSTYDRHLEMTSATSIVAERADGQRLNFTLNGATWTPDTDIDVTLAQSGDTWTLTDRNDTVETYTSTPSVLPGYTVTVPYMQLISIRARNGYTQTLSYGSGLLLSVTDSYNRSLTFAYAGNALRTVTTPDGLVITYGNGPSTPALLSTPTTVSYSTTPETTVTYLYGDSALPSALTGIIDENGNRYATWTYDSVGRVLTSQVGSGANLTTTVYNADGSRTVTNALGVTYTYTFTPLQNMPKVSQISRAATPTTAAATETFTYDGNGYLASQTDWNGNETTYVNDVHGQPTTINEAVGSAVARTTTITYDDPAFVHLPSQIVTPGLTANFTYDGGGELLTSTLTDTTTTTTPYSTDGQTRATTNTWANFLLASVKSPNGNTTSFTYDATGALTAITNALGQTTNITAHTGGGLPLTVVDPNGVTTTLAYDARQRLFTSTVATSQGPRTTAFTYDAAGNLTKTTLPDGSALTNTYDTAHRLTTITDLFHQNVDYTLDALGDRTQTNLTAVGNRIQRQHSDSFDALGRVLQDIGGVGQTTAFAYDPNGNALTITDPLGRVTSRAFDALNRLSTSTDPATGVTTVTYDAHDRPLTVTDPNGNATSYVYDGFGDLIQQTSPDSGKTVYRYDADANLTQKTDAAGNVTDNTFDALDRILTTSYPADATENVAYTYDQAGHGFGIGRLTSLTDAAGSLSRTYDERGNLLSDTRVSGSTTLKTAYSYDAASRIASITYPSGWTVSQTRDVMGRIWQIPVTAPGGASAGNAITNATYEPFGPLYTLTYGNGVNESRRFDLDYRVTGLTDVGTAALQNLTYAYDLDDNVSSIADAVTPGNSQSLGYDLLNRLTAATGAYGALGWTYDKLGNRLTQTLGGATTAYGYTPGTNRLASMTAGGSTTPIAYTATGNISSIPPTTGAPVATLTYNAANRLNTVTGTPVAIMGMVYDAFGQRFSKTSGGATTFFSYGQDGSLLEEMNNEAATDYVYLNGRPVATIAPSSGKLYFLHDDRLGTPQLATDAGQNVVWSAVYQPFGATGVPTGSITQSLRFPGQYEDAETGWNHNGFRDYLSALGRYIESDPIGLDGGVNLYIYAEARPLNKVDPYGLLEVFGFGSYTWESPLSVPPYAHTGIDLVPVFYDYNSEQGGGAWGTIVAPGEDIGGFFGAFTGVETVRGQRECITFYEIKPQKIWGIGNFIPGWIPGVGYWTTDDQYGLFFYKGGSIAWGVGFPVSGTWSEITNSSWNTNLINWLVQSKYANWLF